MLNHDRKVLQDHTPREVWQLFLKQGALASDPAANINEDGSLGINDSIA